MENLDDSENNAKISDSAYSNSCSNSQSRRSHSSKSTHSGSSGSSGYSGKPSTSGSSNKLEQASKKDKDAKEKKPVEATVVEDPAVVECMPPEPVPHCDAPVEEINDVVEVTDMPLALPEKAVENIHYSTTDLGIHKHEIQIATMQAITTANLESSCQVTNADAAGFSCAISMHDGVVMYTTQNLTTNLGFPKDMWIGRSFIDFVHPKDRNTFASQITNGLAVPRLVNCTQHEATSPGMTNCTMVCRIRRYRSLKIGFGLEDRTIAYMPFILKFSFKDIKEEDEKIVYLIIQATPVCSSYKMPNECKTDSTPFIIRHSAAGILEYIDIESVPYLGYLPQDVYNKDALLLYHPDDLPYLKMIYETIVKEGSVAKCTPYRMLAQNGDFVKLETEWSSFINPWSMKVEFVIGKHYIVEGPTTPDVFLSPPVTKPAKNSKDEKTKSQLAETNRDSILKILKEVLTKPAEKAKQLMNKRCHDLALIMESLLEEQPKTAEELAVEIPDPDLNCYERDSVMLGGISPHHEHNDSKSSTETPLSYNQLNYNENLQRYFDSHKNYSLDENHTIPAAVSESAPKLFASICMSPMAQQSGESNDRSSTGSTNAVIFNHCSPPGAGDYQSLRLTESLLTKHNSDMEKELAKYHRGSRTSCKGVKASEIRLKKKEHLARCNATFQPTMAGAAYETAQPHGVKRALTPLEADISNKQHCNQSRQARRRNTLSDNSAALNSNATHTASVVPNSWQVSSNSAQTDPVHPYSIGVQQHLTLLPHMAGVFPMYYAPNSEPKNTMIVTGPSPSLTPVDSAPQNAQAQIITPTMPHQMMHYTNAAMPWMYPQSVYGSPYMCSQMQYNHQHRTAMTHSVAYNQFLTPLGLPNSNYIQACKSTLPLKSNPLGGQAACADRKQADVHVTSTTAAAPPCDDSSIAHNLDFETCPKEKQDDGVSQAAVMKPQPSKDGRINAPNMGSMGQSGQNSDETMGSTDGDFSYSSFYSSFFKTESGSNDTSSDPKKPRTELNKKGAVPFTSCYTYEPQGPKKAARRSMDPPWINQVCVTPELVYKYQIQPKLKEEVLQSDLEKMKKLEQPTLVNEQLVQLYLDMQLEGVASRLTLEEGITSSSSSDETCFSAPVAKAVSCRKRDYSKLTMIYEEDAPLPPPNLEDIPRSHDK